MTDAASASPNNTSPVPRWICDFSTPQPMVALPCGSMSMSSTRRRVAANEAARFTAVVVLPTPPFWFATAMMRFMGAHLSPECAAITTERGLDRQIACCVSPIANRSSDGEYVFMRIERPSGWISNRRRYPRPPWSSN